jgi:uncharacterized membrane protein
LKARLAVLAVFLLGAVCGGVAAHLYAIRVQREILHSPSPLATVLMTQLTRELQLSTEQQERVNAIVMEIREETLNDEEMRTFIMPKVRQVLDKGEHRIRPVLTDQQRARFDALVAERRRLLEQMDQKR